MPYDPERIAKLLIEYREHTGLPWRELGRRMDCHDGTLRAIAKGDTKAMRLDTAYKLAEAMGVEIWHLIGDEPAAIVEARHLITQIRAALQQSRGALAAIRGLESEIASVEKAIGLEDEEPPGPPPPPAER